MALIPKSKNDQAPETSEAEQAAEIAAQVLSQAEPKFDSKFEVVLVVAEVRLLEPNAMIWFEPGIPSEAPLTGWLQSQIDAGLMKLT